MKDGICPKCEAREVHVSNGTSAEVSVRLGAFSSAGMLYYICAACGYVEMYIEKKEDLPRIAAKYPRV